MTPLNLLAWTAALLFGTVVLAVVVMIVAAVYLKIREELVNSNKGVK